MGLKRPEILAPAGNLEKLKTALLYGADAVYLAGERYGLRAFADNFGPEEMAEGLAHAHALGRCVYVTLNIMGHEADLESLSPYLESLEALGVDGLIVADPGILRMAERFAPSIPKHLSTQASVTNAQSCAFWHDLGVSRIVLARELTLEEIASIRSKCPDSLELECFVHGAMCMAYSGRCLLSNMFVGRDGNRGACAQPCRWSYEAELREVKRDGEPLILQQDQSGSYLMNSNDLCMIEHIPALIEAGIDSFKIEGRMKSAYYAAMTAKTYREAVDAYLKDPLHYVLDPLWLDELEQMVHRPYETGFYFAKPGQSARIASQATYLREAEVLGLVLDCEAATGSTQGGYWLTMEQRNKSSVGETVEIVGPSTAAQKKRITALRNSQGQAIESSPHPKMLYQMWVDVCVEPGSFVRRRACF